MRVETVDYYPQPRLHQYGFETGEWRDFVTARLASMYLLRRDDERDEETMLFRPFKVYLPELGDHPVAIRSLRALSGLYVALHDLVALWRPGHFATPPPRPWGQRKGYDGEWYEYDSEYDHFGRRLEEPHLAPWADDSKQWQMQDHLQWTFYYSVWRLVTPHPTLLDKDGEPIFILAGSKAPEKTTLGSWHGFEEPETERFPYNPRLRVLLDSEENDTTSAYLEHLLGRITSALEEALSAAED